MRIIGRIALGLVAAFVVLVAVVVVRTFLAFTPGTATAAASVRVAPAVTVDVAGAAQRLSQAIQIPTVRHQDKAEDVDAEWTRLHALLATNYPAAHAAMTREELASRTLVYTWPGSDKTLAPIVLMAHQDVVPVTPGAEGDWKHPPFAGVIAEDAVWGRGAIDDKGSLIGIFEAIEALAKQGFQPKRTIMIVSGGDEEVIGQGARAAAALLKLRGITAEFVLDEGMAVINDNPITGSKVAIIGTAEKGYGTLRVTAKAAGGHSSAPPADSGGVVTLSKALVAIADDQFPLAFRGPGADMVKALAPTAPFVVRMAVANEWLFGGLLTKQAGATPAGAALLHTTIAPTMLKGSPKENVLPQDATAWINYRIAPGDTSATVMARAKSAVGDLPVTLAWNSPPNEPSPVSSTQSWGWQVVAATAGAVAGAPVAPSLVTAGTDSRFLTPVAKDVYRFQPVEFDLKDVAMIHGTNEHMTLKNLEKMVQFYARLVVTATQ
ncbi:MAG: M20 family peptidase [Alphaproteobacteria bacterium]|nr:M20 family peptidase [Alphaproteobacteria bacterium]MBU1512574.1 M20 family peptidase [Alphaproteobacteria bacterium]MBU2092913.1 M20 family peptidase [Alphaproteobacteria bacterium]MBU2150848.1 M20 family peptidase [Alphaproteobacteria bacterium]MBU2307941.1 M20 family peptidase [Alphaproteobacteria bacterium]